MRVADKGEGMPQGVADTGGIVVRGCLKGVDSERLPSGADNSEGMPAS